MTTSMISPSLFYFVAFVAVFGGIMMVLSKNLFHSALFMALSFIAIAGVYATLHLSFIAVVQIIVYVGAITILIIFGIMLTHHHGHGETNKNAKTIPGAALVAVSLATLVSVAVRSLPFVPLAEIPDNVVQNIGFHLFGYYILPTELAAILLLGAMIGAVMVSKEGSDAK